MLARVEPAEIRPTSLGKLSAVVRLGLEKAPPGEYELVMAFLDMVAGKMLEVREPFSVRAAAEAPPAASSGPGSSPSSSR
jgi:hypothetical protein